MAAVANPSLTAALASFLIDKSSIITNNLQNNSQIQDFLSRLLFTPQSLQALPLPWFAPVTLLQILLFIDITLLTAHTARSGTASFLDIFTLSPGLAYLIPSLGNVHRGEYPATAALTTGYVFRIENAATVRFLQDVGRTGCLVTLRVAEIFSSVEWSIYWAPNVASALWYLLPPLLTLDVVVGLYIIGDIYGLLFIALFLAARLASVVAIRRRLSPTWHGAPEPGVAGDLLILLSQDRWIRMRGPVDDLKAVTSGQWLRDAGVFERALRWATVGCMALAVCVGEPMGRQGMMMVWVFLGLQMAVLGSANMAAGQVLKMNGRRLEVAEGPKEYEGRRDLVEELVGEYGGRDDWAVSMGMIPPKKGKASGPVTM